MKPGSRRIFMIPKATSILGMSIIIYYLLRRERDPFVFFFFFFQLFWNILRRCCRSIYLSLTSCIVDDVRDGASWRRFAFNLAAIGSLRWFFSTFFPTTRSSTDRCRTLVAMRHNLRHMRASRRRASRGESLDRVYCAGS